LKGLPRFGRRFDLFLVSLGSLALNFIVVVGVALLIGDDSRLGGLPEWPAILIHLNRFLFV